MSFGDKYVLEVPLGESESGTVWAAKESASGRRVVIAMLDEDAPDLLKIRLLEHGGALASLTHPNVVRVFEAGTNEEGAPYLVMERLEGISLAKRWEASPGLRADRTLEVGTGIVDALAKVHSLKLPGGEPLVHGDVEPGNVLLVGAPGKEIPKLIGFGINRTSSRLGTPGSRASLSTLQPFAFAAPEQTRGEVESSVTADLYSAAAIVFAGLTGRPPHVGTDPAALADAIAKEPAPLFTSLRKDLAPFAATLDRALASDPKRRYADAGALARALRTALAMGRIVGSKDTPIGQRLALANAGAAAPGTRSPSRMPPRPSSPPQAAEPAKADAAAKPIGLEPPKAPDAKPSEASAKPSEASAKPSEASAKPSEASAKPSHAPPEHLDGIPSGDLDGIPSSELELVSGETSLPPSPPKSVRPPPPPPAPSIPELTSGEVDLEPTGHAAPKSAPPPPPVAGRFAAPAPPDAPHSPQSVVEAAPAVAGWIALPEPTPTSEPPRAEPPSEPLAAAPVAPSPSVLDDLEDLPPADDAPSPLTPVELPDDELTLSAANGPPRWLVAALSVTVVLLSGILVWMRWGQSPRPVPTESLGTILAEGGAPPSTTITPPVTTAIAPHITIPPITAPPVVVPPVVVPPVIVPPVVIPPVVTPPITTRPPVTTSTTGSGTTRTGSTGTGSTRTGTGTHSTSTSHTGTSMTGGTSMTSMTGGTMTGSTSMTGTRTTVVTDPGF